MQAIPEGTVSSGYVWNHMAAEYEHNPQGLAPPPRHRWPPASALVSTDCRGPGHRKCMDQARRAVASQSWGIHTCPYCT